MTIFRRRGLAILLCLIGLIVVAALVLRTAFGWYLQSQGFQQRLASAVGRVLKAEGTFMPIHYSAGTFYSDGFAARGSAGAFFSDLRADQIRAVFNWRGLLDRRWEIDEIFVQNVDLHFAERSEMKGGSSSPLLGVKPGGEAEIANTARGAAGPPPNKWRLDLRRASVAQSSWRWGGNAGEAAGGITQAAFTLTPSGDSWLIQANGGKVSQTGWPELSIESARLRYNGDSLFINESVLRTGTGRIAVNGEVAFDRAADIKAQFEDLPITPLLTPDWRLKLNGKLAGAATIHAPFPNGDLHVEGNVRLIDGQLEALPLLDQIATFTRTERFRRLTLTRGSLSFSRDAGLITAKDVVLESEGLLRVEGACTVVNNQIDGVFQIGVTAASLQWLPGSQARVFTIAHDGYYWTPLRITGPVSHPNEDLTGRLVAAAAGELLEGAQDTIRDTAKSLLDLLPH